MFKIAPLLAALLLLPLTPVTADDHGRARELVQQGTIKPLTELLQSLPEPYRGTILEVELEEEHGTTVYELEILDASGTVHKLHVDARSGEVLKARRRR